MFKQIQAISASYANKVQFALEAEQTLRPGELLKLTGPAIFLDKVSKNGRKYIPESVHMQVAELQPRIAKKALYGELDHPPVNDLNRLAYVQMKEVSHRIDALWYDPNKKTYYMTVTILDTPNGRILKTLYDAGSPLYVSLRSLLDPARNVQRNGYVDAFMLALITIDFVSNPGFSDAELQAIDASTESALAVCEALNVFSSKIFEDMSKTKNKYVPVIAMEGIAGVATEPSEKFANAVASFIADMLNKFPEKFNTRDFVNAYPESMYDGHIVGLYEDTAELILKDSESGTVAIIKLDKPIDGEYKLTEEPAEYFNTQVMPQSNKVNTSEPAQEMYAVVATEGYEPSDEFIETAGEVASYMGDQYGDGFTAEQFDELRDELDNQFSVKSELIDDGDKLRIKFMDKDCNDGACIDLDKDDDGVMHGTSISEYFKPEAEPAAEKGCEGYEIGKQIKLIDASGDTVVEGTLEEVGKFGELSDTIAEEDPEGYQIMQSNDVDPDKIVMKINGGWYYVEDGMQCEECNATECDMVATEAEVEIIDGEDPDPLKLDPNYMKKSDLKSGDELDPDNAVDEVAEILDTQEELNDQMYEVIEDNTPKAEIVDEPAAEKKPEDTSKKDDDPNIKHDPVDDGQQQNELAVEAQRIFDLPNSKFAGNYAIEHIPAAYKHIWAGLTQAAREVIAMQAKNAQIATEAQNLAFWSKTNFIAIERACIQSKASVEAALESMQLEDPRKNFLGKPLRSAK